MGSEVNATPRPLYPLERDPVPIVYEAMWAPGPVWADAENLSPTAIRSPDRLARSESLYRLSHPGPHIQQKLRYLVTVLQTRIELLPMHCNEHVKFTTLRDVTHLNPPYFTLPIFKTKTKKLLKKTNFTSCFMQGCSNNHQTHTDI
jgi:hypothetical protein